LLAVSASASGCLPLARSPTAVVFIVGAVVRLVGAIASFGNEGPPEDALPSMMETLQSPIRSEKANEILVACYQEACRFPFITRPLETGSAIYVPVGHDENTHDQADCLDVASRGFICEANEWIAAMCVLAYEPHLLDVSTGRGTVQGAEAQLLTPHRGNPASARRARTIILQGAKLSCSHSDFSMLGSIAFDTSNSSHDD
jgi:hypothetical protein